MDFTISIRSTALLGMIAALAACGRGQGGAPGDAAGGANGSSGTAAPTAQITPAARQEAQQIFSTRCAVCHGPQGYGDGPGGAALNPKPRNYHDVAWQDSVTDKEIETAIVRGGAAVGRSPAMVGNPDLAGKPAVVAALREMIRGFGKQQKQQ